MVKPKSFIDDVASERALCEQFVCEARKQLFQHLPSAGEEAVRMAPLRDPFAGLVGFRELHRVRQL